MRLLTFEHSPAAYRADFALSGLAIVTLSGSLLASSPHRLALELAGRCWHALLHRRQGPGVCYGVTSPLWDHVFGSTSQAGRARPR
jgi:sterol desaturase/sphingolipid hydroxylase (fatty acid hydroxylase superfamily)